MATISVIFMRINWPNFSRWQIYGGFRISGGISSPRNSLTPDYIPRMITRSSCISRVKGSERRPEGRERGREGKGKGKGEKRCRGREGRGRRMGSPTHYFRLKGCTVATDIKASRGFSDTLIAFVLIEFQWNFCSLKSITIPEKRDYEDNRTGPQFVVASLDKRVVYVFIR